MAHDWFRLGQWDAAARTEFENRLARSRSWNRAQYLRIQGLTLWQAGDLESAKKLLLRVLRDYPEDELEAAGATEHLAEIEVQEGDLVAAASRLRSLLSARPDLDGTTGTAELMLADILSRQECSAAQVEARALLNNFLDREDIRLSTSMFRWHLVHIQLAEHRGDHQAAGSHAADALELAAAGPQFPRHQDVGVVQTDEVTLQRLRRLAQGATPWPDGPYGRVPQDNRQDGDPEQDLLKELARAGIVSHDIWFLDPGAPGYERALPILIRHLQDDRYPDDARDGIARALATPLVTPYWRQLAEYHPQLHPALHSTQMGLAAALAETASKEHLPDVLNILRDQRWGENRIFFLRTLTRLRLPDRWALIEGLTTDPEIGTEARHMLTRKRRRASRPAP